MGWGRGGRRNPLVYSESRVWPGSPGVSFVPSPGMVAAVEVTAWLSSLAFFEGQDWSPGMGCPSFHGAWGGAGERASNSCLPAARCDVSRSWWRTGAGLHTHEAGPRPLWRLAGLLQAIDL